MTLGFNILGFCSGRKYGRPTSVQDIKQRIARNKLRNGIFAMVGLLSTLVGLVLLSALLIDLAADGTPA